MVDALLWLSTLEFLGVLGFLLAFALFSRLPDRGFSVAKGFALLLLGYLLWVFGLTQLIPNSFGTILAIILLGAAVAVWLAIRQRQSILLFLRSEWRTLLITEGIFLAVFLLWIGIVSEIPAISHTEKPMDFAFLNALIRAEHFPPEDPWLAGHPISYYYFGHLIMASLTQLTASAPAVGYNIAVALIPALVAAASFGLLYNLIRLSGGSQRAGLGYALLAPVLVVLIGNLEGVFELAHNQVWGGSGFWHWLGIKGLDGAARAAPGYNIVPLVILAMIAAGAFGLICTLIRLSSGSRGAGLGYGLIGPVLVVLIGKLGGVFEGIGGIFPDQGWWWWRATRVIDTLVDGQSLDYTITEFPFFSFILGDLHAHVISLPFLLLFLSLALNLFLSSGKVGLDCLRSNPLEFVAVALVLGSLSFINIWDFPTYAAILGLLLLAKAYRESWEDRLSPGSPPQLDPLSLAARNTALMWIPLVALAALLFLPFYLDFSSQAGGILPYTGPGTRPLLFLVVIGLPFLLSASFLLKQLGGIPRLSHADAPALLTVLTVGLSPFLLWAVLIVSLSLFAIGAGLGVGLDASQIEGRTLFVLPGLAVVCLAGFSALQRLKADQERMTVFPLLLVMVALYLLMGAELYFLVDLFGNRMNTIFKVYYQAWLLLALAGAYGIYYWQAHAPLRNPVSRLAHYGWTGVAALAIIASLYYPVGAVLERTGLLHPGETLADNTLNGLAFVKDTDPDEYAAIAWLRTQDSHGIIVEAVGADYSSYGRVSGSTGIPTILGWKGHELQWRGTSKLFDGREETVAEIYQSPNPSRVRGLLERYDVQYVYAGRREQISYGKTQLGGFPDLLRTVYQQGNVTIYEVVAETESTESSGGDVPNNK